MLSVLATVKPGEKKVKAAVSKPIKAKTAKTNSKKRPKPHDDARIEYSEFVPLPPEENVPEPAVLVDIAYDAEEIEQEPEEIDEWHAAMQAAEEEFEAETALTDRTDVGVSLEEDFSDVEEPYFEASSPQPTFKRIQKAEKTRTYHGAPLEFDDEFVP